MNKVVFSALAIAILTFSLAPSAFADDDPPTRVGRLSYIQGDVSIQPGDSDDWSWASLNRPLTTGDNVWTQERGRAEIRIGSTSIRADEKTSISLLNIDDHSLQLGVNAGSVIIHVKHIPDGGYFEVDTPNAAITLQQPGDYRINADDSGDFSSLSVRSGAAEVDGSHDAFQVDADTNAEISGTDHLTYDLYDLPQSDEFDRWSRTRDWRTAKARSTQYVSPELTGYEDLDGNGTWVSDPTYGNVWEPQNVAEDWTPFRDGHWAWIQPWGWTWLDDTAWGYATSHYGRWTYLSAGRWGWVPPQREVGYSWPVYSPANVVFISNTPYINPDGPVISWIPLGPGEVYYPGYQCSYGYVTRLNGTNTVLRRDWDHGHHHGDHDHWGDHDRWDGRGVTPRDYRNALIAGAVVAVGAEIFSSSHHVGRSAVHVDQHAILTREIAAAAPVVPVKASTQAPAVDKGAAAPPRPPRQVRDRQVVARQAPPPRPIPFDRQQRLLEKNAGKPLDASAEQTLRAEHAAPMPAVKTVAPPAQVTPVVQEKKEHGPPRKHFQDTNAGSSAPVTPTDRPAAVPVPVATPQDQRQQQQQQRQDERQKAQQLRQQQDDQRKAEQQQSDQQRQQEQQQREEERQKQAEQRKAEQLQADQQAEQQRLQQEEQHKAAQQQAEQQRQLEQQQRTEEQQKADTQRQQQLEQRKAEQELQRQQQDEARQKKLDEQLKAREPQPATPDATKPVVVTSPDGTTPVVQPTDGKPVRHHEKGSNGRPSQQNPQPEAAPVAPVDGKPGDVPAEVPADTQKAK